jgi:hypothetical protein
VRLSNRDDDLTIIIERKLTDRVLGTPNEEAWPGVTSLPDYKPTFPQWNGVDLSVHIRGLDHIGLDLLASMLVYDPSHRMSGKSPVRARAKRVHLLYASVSRTHADPQPNEHFNILTSTICDWAVEPTIRRRGDTPTYTFF